MRTKHTIGCLVILLLFNGCTALTPTRQDADLYEEYMSDVDTSGMMENRSREPKMVVERYNDPPQFERRLKKLRPEDKRMLSVYRETFNGPRLSQHITLARYMLKNIRRGDAFEWVQTIFGPPHFTGKAGRHCVWAYAIPFPYKIYVFFTEDGFVDAVRDVTRMD